MHQSTTMVAEATGLILQARRVITKAKMISTAFRNAKKLIEK